MSPSERAWDAEDPWASQGSPPSWLGDVSDGVDAWVGKAGEERSAADQAGRGGNPKRGGGSRKRRTRRGPATESGTEPTPEEDAEPDHETVARKILLDQLTGRARSRRELADKLASRNVPDEIAARLLNRFTEVGLIDDAAYARMWVSQRQQGKGLARRALAQELRRKGIDDDDARQALEEIDSEDEREVGRRLIRKKLRSMSRLDDQVKTRRLVGMLARKGYSGSVAYGLVREELAEDGVDAPEGMEEFPS